MADNLASDFERRTEQLQVQLDQVRALAAEPALRAAPDAGGGDLCLVQRNGDTLRAALPDLQALVRAELETVQRDLVQVDGTGRGPSRADAVGAGPGASPGSRACTAPRP